MTSRGLAGISFPARVTIDIRHHNPRLDLNVGHVADRPLGDCRQLVQHPNTVFCARTLFNPILCCGNVTRSLTWENLLCNLINMPEPQENDTANADADTGSTQSTFPKTFVFITDNSTAERKRARVHAVREHHRRRRWHNINAPNTRTQLQLTWRKKQCSPATKQGLIDSVDAPAQPPVCNRQTADRSNVVSVFVCGFFRLNLARLASSL